MALNLQIHDHDHPKYANKFIEKLIDGTAVHPTATQHGHSVIK
jgi:hypothetical protein